jgi:competence ComEA-like helix-hairpin-helix protein
MKRLILFAPFVVFSLVPAASAQDLPAGKGKDVVEEICTACHGADLISSRRASKQEWGEIVGDMVSRGATATKEQIQAINDYLLKNYGQVNANKAPSAEIATVLDVTAAQADAIVKYRTDNGAFKTVEDLKKVPGLGPANLDTKKDRLVF